MQADTGLSENGYLQDDAQESSNSQQDSIINKKRFWILYAFVVAVAFLTSGVTIKEPIYAFGLEVKIDFSSIAWLLPVAVLAPFIFALIATRGGAFEGFGIKAQINAVREKADRARGTANTTYDELSAAITDLWRRIEQIEAKKEIQEPIDETASTENGSFEERVEKLVKQYGAADAIEKVGERLEIDEKVRNLPDVCFDEVVKLIKKQPEHKMVASLLLSRFAGDKDNAEKAFLWLLKLSKLDTNSRVRYRAADSIARNSWLFISSDRRDLGIRTIEKRAQIEPNNQARNKLLEAARKLRSESI